MEYSSKKRKITFIDIIITVIILVAVALLAYIFIFNRSTGDTVDTVKIQYTLEVKNERDELVDNAAANIGKTLVEGTAKYNIGTVSDFYHFPSTYPTFNHETGESVNALYPEHSNVCFVVNADAVKNPYTGRYSIEGFELSVGTLVYVRLPEYAGTSYCTSIKEVE